MDPELLDRPVSQPASGSLPSSKRGSVNLPLEVRATTSPGVSRGSSQCVLPLHQLHQVAVEVNSAFDVPQANEQVRQSCSSPSLGTIPLLKAGAPRPRQLEPLTGSAILSGMNEITKHVRASTAFIEHELPSSNKGRASPDRFKVLE